MRVVQTTYSAIPSSSFSYSSSSPSSSPSYGFNATMMVRDYIQLFYLLFYFLYISSEFLILFFTLMSSCERICKSLLVSYCIYAHSWNVVSVGTKPKEVVNNIGQSSMKFKYAHLLLTLGYIFPIFCLKH